MLQTRETRFLAHAAPQLDDGRHAFELLVAIQRDEIRLGNSIEYGRNRGEPIYVGRDRSSELELEIAVPIGGDRLFETFRQAVVETPSSCLLARERIDKADRVPDENRTRRMQAGKESGEIE